MRDEYLEALYDAEQALRALLTQTEPGTGMTLHTAFNTLKDSIAMAERERDGDSPQDSVRPAGAPTMDEWKEDRASWAKTPYLARQHLLIEVLGDDRLTIAELTERLHEKVGHTCVWKHDVRSMAAKMLARGDLDRVGERDSRNRTRYRYFRRAALEGPIADLQRAFDEAAGT